MCAVGEGRQGPLRAFEQAEKQIQDDVLSVSTSRFIADQRTTKT